MYLRIILHYKIIAEVGYRGKDTTNSKYTLQGVPEQMSMRHFFLGHLVLLFSIVAWGRPYGFSDFVRELSSCLFSHLMLVTVKSCLKNGSIFLKFHFHRLMWCWPIKKKIADTIIEIHYNLKLMRRHLSWEHLNPNLTGILLYQVSQKKCSFTRGSPFCLSPKWTFLKLVYCNRNVYSDRHSNSFIPVNLFDI